MGRTIFTIGYEGATPDRLVATLKEAGVSVLLDVRAVPLSRKPGFSKNVLASRLAEQGIRYVGLKGLGTPAEGRSAARKGHTGEMRSIFITHLDTADAQRDMETAAQIVVAESACLLCFEHEPRCCHRLVVADILAARTGAPVQHLNPVVGSLL